MKYFAQLRNSCTHLKKVKNIHGGVLLARLPHGCFSRFLYCTNGRDHPISGERIVKGKNNKYIRQNWFYKQMKLY